MVDVIYMHLCDYAFAGEGGKPCIIGAFEFIHAPTVPTQNPLMYLAMALRGRPHEATHFVVNISDPNGQEFARIDADANLGEAGQHFIPMRLPNVVFPMAGVYTFTVVAGNRELARTSLHVRLPAAPVAPARPN